MRCTVVLAFVLALAGPVALRAAYFETSVPPRAKDRYKSADYRLWVPDGVRTLAGVIVKQHGCGRAGLAHANDLQWQALARKWDCALLGTHLQAQTNDCSDWHRPENGSWWAFVTALEKLAQASGHAELESVPWAIWGHSGGAHWAVAMAANYPHRTLAVFAQSGGMAGTNSPADELPIMFNRGAEDLTNIIAGVDASYQGNRPAGALWALSIAPKTKHECGHGRQLAIAFFDATLAQRLPLRPGSGDLRRPDKVRAWLGDLKTFEIAPEAWFTGDRRLAAWLPDATSARAWQEFQRTGAVPDQTPPNAPTDVKTVFEGKTVKLSWSASADLESGLKSFNIYRDGTLLAAWKGPTNTVAGGFFQAGNYGDEAEPTLPEMRFTDVAPASGRHRYQVTTINWADLESPRSEPAMVELK